MVRKVNRREHKRRTKAGSTSVKKHSMTTKGKSGRMSYEADDKYKKMSVKEAKEIVGNRADWELKHMKKALSGLRLMNTEEEEQRLAAVRVMLKNRSGRMVPPKLKHKIPGEWVPPHHYAEDELEDYATMRREAGEAQRNRSKRYRDD